MNRCPRDQEALQPFGLEPLPVSRCGACRGTWLAGADVEASLGRALPRRSDTLRAGATWLKCPNDGVLLRSIEHRGVAVERCPDCGGIWLDPGELRAIVRGQWAGTGADVVLVQAAGEVGGHVGVALLEFLGELLSGAS